MGNKESQSGFWSGLVSKFVSRAALKLEHATTAPLPDERISRRELFRRGKKKGQELWWVPLAAGSSALALALWAKIEADSHIRLSSNLAKDSKLIPSGERLVFFKPDRTFQLSDGNGRITVLNRTRNLYLGINMHGLEIFMREEQVDIARLGSIDFLVISNLPATAISISNRTVLVNIHESNNSLAEKDFLGKESQDLSSSIGAILFLGKDARFWQSMVAVPQLIKSEQQRLLTKLDPQKTPPFSLWRHIPD